MRMEEVKRKRKIGGEESRSMVSEKKKKSW